MRLADRPWTAIADGTYEVALLPVGSTEQHGPHAPLGTDTLAAEAIADEAASRVAEPVVVAPPIPVGVAAEHRHFAGTLWVSEDTFRDYVGETIESLFHHGSDRVVVVNGHGGNVAPLREVCGRLTRERAGYAVPYTWFDAIDTADLVSDGDDDGGTDERLQMGHGGPLETSLLRAVRSDLVDEAAFETARAEGATRWGEWHAGVNLAYDTVEFSESGVVGDPGESSVRLGETLLEAASDRLADLIGAVVARDGPE